MKAKNYIIDIILILLYTAASNCGIFIIGRYEYLVFAVPVLIAVNLIAGAGYSDIPTTRLKMVNHGTVCIEVFYFSLIIGIFWQAAIGVQYIPDEALRQNFYISAGMFAICEFVIFWNGIISVYCSSVQLGIRIRVIGLLVGMIPLANLMALWVIMRTCREEVTFETEKSLLNLSRAEDKVCATKYPILLVHGFFFRDYKHFNYWGRIPFELSANGAIVYYGEQQSAASVADSAEELSKRIKQIVEDTGCGKVNIIAHSKGGLDTRCAIHNGMAPYVASLTTVSTPHRGCLFADALLKKISPKVQQKVADAYNYTQKKLGDKNPDFLAGVYDLTAEKCAVYDKEFTVPEGIYCQSFGSELKHGGYAKFPLNFCYHIVKSYGGRNDGLVAYDSFSFGEKFTYIVPRHGRGISHGDMIDLNRENIKDFDVREFYVKMVSDLKDRGL
ncbi:MAG: triacylglycerol lipase [Clostridia bacterium]|nr:triacylglycerol lipase [Clostridia bacterium]